MWAIVPSTVAFVDAPEDEVPSGRGVARDEVGVGAMFKLAYVQTSYSVHSMAAQWKRRTCQFAPASFSNSRSSIFSRTFPLRMLSQRARGACPDDVPLHLRHTPLVLSLCALQ